MPLGIRSSGLFSPSSDFIRNLSPFYWFHTVSGVDQLHALSKYTHFYKPHPPPMRLLQQTFLMQSSCQGLDFNSEASAWKGSGIGGRILMIRVKTREGKARFNIDGESLQTFMLVSTDDCCSQLCPERLHYAVAESQQILITGLSAKLGDCSMLSPKGDIYITYSKAQETSQKMGLETCKIWDEGACDETRFLHITW